MEGDQARLAFAKQHRKTRGKLGKNGEFPWFSSEHLQKVADLPPFDSSKLSREFQSG